MDGRTLTALVAGMVAGIAGLACAGDGDDSGGLRSVVRDSAGVTIIEYVDLRTLDRSGSGSLEPGP